MESLNDALLERAGKSESLLERVDGLVQASRAPLEWGSALVSTTPTSLAILELSAQIAALQKAVREISLEVQKLSGQS